MIAIKIEEFVKEGMTDPCEMRRVLNAFIKSCVLDSAPQSLDRARCPSLEDIRNHVYRAKAALQLYKFDQQNLSLMIKEWQTSKVLTNHYFRPHRSSTGEHQCDGNVEYSTEQGFLWVHQGQWQRDLLSHYGNAISLMDATY